MLRALVLTTMLSTSALAQDVISTKPVTAEEMKATLNALPKLPTFPEVEAKKVEIDKVIASKNCDLAVPLIGEYEREAAMLIVLSLQGQEPGRRLPEDIRSRIRQPWKTDEVIKRAELLSVNRAEAIVGQAECFASQGAPQLAAMAYRSALDVIPPSQSQLWIRAAHGLWTLIGATTADQ